MSKEETLELLRAVENGTCRPEEAVEKLSLEPFARVSDYAEIDLHRELRQGQKEVIYGAGKTAEQISGILKTMQENHLSNILITRLDTQKAAFLGEKYPLFYDEPSGVGIAFPTEQKEVGNILVITAGTSDIPVAKEAFFTAKAFGNRVQLISDVGVAGLHRLLHRLPDIQRANVIIAVAGMEGALASVIGGLASCPVIAVPTSVGYGASFGGVSALLSMLNSCASGVSVVNIDNGFGAGYLASMINKIYPET